jgi:hypothetical protein
MRAVLGPHPFQGLLLTADWWINTEARQFKRISTWPVYSSHQRNSRGKSNSIHESIFLSGRAGFWNRS